jgi:hypothetical protein
MKGHSLPFLLLLCACLYPSIDPAAAQQIVCSGEAAGGYAAFPDICRLDDGQLLCIFYSGYGHISLPKDEWPKGGRIMGVRSSDEGKTWSAPAVLIDTTQDDRDPSVAKLADGTLLCNWFIYRPDIKGKEGIKTVVARSADRGLSWSEPLEIMIDAPFWSACSAPVRILPDGNLILGLYHESADGSTAFGATIKSYDQGRTWKDLALIGEHSGVRLDAETDVIALKDGSLLAALRSDQSNLHTATSADMGKTWSAVSDSGFKGHCPHLMRHSSGVILMGVRLPGTALYWTTDEAKTWKGPLQVDSHIGAYPSMLELNDGTVYFVFYEEGAGSSIRGVRLKVSGESVEVLPD